MKLLPTGIENFKTMIDKSAYYVDKTNFIEDVLNEQVVSYTRPRRFGKTLNMSMLYYFFSIKEKENAYLFDGLNISKNKDVLKVQNKYPTIFISLKEMKSLTFDAQISSFSNVIYELLEKNLEILSSDQLSDTTKDILNKLHNRSSCIDDLKISLRVITNALYTYYQQKVIVLIDEYDVPLQAAYQNNACTSPRNRGRDVLRREPFRVRCREWRRGSVPWHAWQYGPCPRKHQPQRSYAFRG